MSERISGEEIRRLREERGWSQSELADVLNAALGRKYRRGAVSQWEREKDGRTVPLAASEFLKGIASEPFEPHGNGDGPLPSEATLPPQATSQRVAEDLPPSRIPELPPLATGSGVYAKACTDLWEIVATGVGVVGAGIGSEALVADGQIIARDKGELGKAWGKLAETNETFRKMIDGMTEGGAWLQVAVVTGSTFSKCYQSHSEIAQRQRQARAMPPPPPEDEDGTRLHAIS